MSNNGAMKLRNSISMYPGCRGVTDALKGLARPACIETWISARSCAAISLLNETADL